MYKKLFFVDDKILVTDSEGDITTAKYEEGIEEYFFKRNELELVEKNYDFVNREYKRVLNKIGSYKGKQLGLGVFAAFLLFISIFSITFLDNLFFGIIYFILSGFFVPIMFMEKESLKINKHLLEDYSEEKDKIEKKKNKLEKEYKVLEDKFMLDTARVYTVPFDLIDDTEELKEVVKEYLDDSDIDERIAELKIEREKLIAFNELLCEKNKSCSICQMAEKGKSLVLKKD